MNAQALIDRYGTELDSAARYVHRLCPSVEYDDLYMLAAERLIAYGNGTGWRGNDKLLASLGPEVDRQVQQALNGDLLNYAHKSIGADSYRRNLDKSDRLSYINKAELDPETADYIDVHFPLMSMHYLRGMSEREIAGELESSRGRIRGLLGKERGAFAQWTDGRKKQPKHKDHGVEIKDGHSVYGRTRNKITGGWNEHEGDNEQVADYELDKAETAIDNTNDDRKQRLSLFIIEHGGKLIGNETMDELRVIAESVA